MYHIQHWHLFGCICNKFCIYHINKEGQDFAVGCWKSCEHEFNWTHQFVRKLHYFSFTATNMTNKHHSWSLFSASCVDFSCQTGTRMLSVSGLVELGRLKWQTPQHEIDTMMKIGVQTDQACIGVDFSAGWILGSEWGSLMLMRCLHTRQSVVFMGTQKVVSSRK